MSQMKARVAIAATANLLVLAGCAVGGVPGVTPSTDTSPSATPSVTPVVFAGFPAGTLLDGRFTFGGDAPNTTGLAAGNKLAGVKGATTSVDLGGYFSWSTGITTGSDYQLYFDDGGQFVADAAVNTVGVFVSDPVVAGPTDLKTPQKTIDLKWAAAYSPAPNASSSAATVAFSWQPIANLDAEYGLSVFNSAGSAQNTTTFGTSNTFTWDRTDTNGDPAPAGTYYYVIKFRKTGASAWSGTDHFYGQTKKVAFTIQ